MEPLSSEQGLLGAAVAAVSFVISVALVPVARRLARPMGTVDVPRGRRLHREPIPRNGGIAVFASFVTAVLLGSYALRLPPLASLMRATFGEALLVMQGAHSVEGQLASVLVGGSIAFLVGLLDDVMGERFPPLAKALGQVLAALVVMGAGIGTTFLPYPWMNGALTLLWIVGITNAFNLIDNMDGLSAGVAFVACTVFLINAWSLGEFFISLILLALLGSLMGFLLFNFHPASIFLGDCGSLFIGFMLASLTLLGRYVPHASSSVFPVLMPVLVLAVPLVDTGTVIVIRLREGRPIYVGDRCHLSHRLLALGFSERSGAIFLYLATYCIGLGSVLLPRASVAEGALILVQSVVLVALLLLLLFLVRPASGVPPAEEPVQLGPGTSGTSGTATATTTTTTKTTTAWGADSSAESLRRPEPGGSPSSPAAPQEVTLQ